MAGNGMSSRCCLILRRCPTARLLSRHYIMTLRPFSRTTPSLAQKSPIQPPLLLPFPKHQKEKRHHPLTPPLAQSQKPKTASPPPCAPTNTGPNPPPRPTQTSSPPSRRAKSPKSSGSAAPTPAAPKPPSSACSPATCSCTATSPMCYTREI